MKRAKKSVLRIPACFMMTTLPMAFAGAVACGGGSSSAPDAASDTTLDITNETAPDVSSEGDGALDVASSGDAYPDATADTAMDGPALEDSVAADAPSDTQLQGDCNLGMAIDCVATVDGAACPGFVCSFGDCPMDAGCLPLA